MFNPWICATKLKCVTGLACVLLKGGGRAEQTMLSIESQFERTLANLGELARTWANLGELGRTWANLGELGRTWANLSELERTL